MTEGVVTGAADTYYRIAGKPAATLLHLGPGLGNGLSNLRNATTLAELEHELARGLAYNGPYLVELVY